MLMTAEIEKYIARFNNEVAAKYIDIVDHLPTLRSLAHGTVVEIGVRDGSSTNALLLGIKENGGHLYSIDITAKCGTIFNDEDWTFIHGDSGSPETAAKVPQEIDVLFVDGDHEYQYVKLDLMTYGPRVKKGGIILMHDVLMPDLPGVFRAYEEYAASRKEVKLGSWGLGILYV